MSLPSADAASRKLLCFAVGGQSFALPIDAVKETIEARPLTRLFLVPPFVAGLINLRGDVVAVLDLLALLALPAAREQGRNIVILRASLLSRGLRHSDRHAANRAGCGLYVDALEGVRDVATADVKPPPSTLAAEPAAFLEGVAVLPAEDGLPQRPLVILSPEKIVGSDKLRAFRRPSGPNTKEMS